MYSGKIEVIESRYSIEEVIAEERIINPNASSPEFFENVLNGFIAQGIEGTRAINIQEDGKIALNLFPGMFQRVKMAEPDERHRFIKKYGERLSKARVSISDIQHLIDPSKDF